MGWEKDRIYLGKRPTNQTGTNGCFSERNTKPTDLELYFKFTTSADLF
jgi:hypothetical protein